MTAVRETVPFPVIVPGANPDRAAVVVLDLEVRSFGWREAPVVMRFRPGNEKFRVYEYRLADGSLWVPIFSWREVLVEELHLVPETYGLGTTELYATGALHAPDLHIRHSNKERNRYRAPQVIRDAFLGGSWERTARQVAPEADECICLIEGRVYMRSMGPVLRTSWRAGPGVPKFDLGHGRLISQVISSSPLTFSALQRGRVTDLVERRFGRAEIKPYVLEVLEEVPASDQLDRLAAERAVWHFLYEIGKKGPAVLSEDVILLSMDVVEILEKRWPGINCSFAFDDWRQPAGHLYGRTAPIADDLLPILDRMILLGDEVAPDAVRSWEVVRDRFGIGSESKAIHQLSELVSGDFAMDVI